GLASALPGKPKGVGAAMTYTALSLGTLVAIAAGVIGLMLLLDDKLNRGTSKPQALFEIRLPPATTIPENRRGIEVELNTDKNSSSAFFHDEWRKDGNRLVIFFFSSRRRHTRLVSDWSSDVCSSD